MAGTRIKFIRVELRFKFVSSRDGFSTESLADFFCQNVPIKFKRKKTLGELQETGDTVHIKLWYFGETACVGATGLPV